MNAPIVEIKRFAVHDGDGIRTTVFLKGCPLKCVWCHNPEAIEPKATLAFFRDKCIFCGACASACPVKAHRFSEKGHFFDRTACVRCGACEKVCLSDALKFYGRSMTPDALLPLLLEDRDFYENSGGGVTVSGGEALMHPTFVAELLRLLKEHGIRTAVDTCGFVSRTSLDAVLPYTDIFLYDVKAFNEEVHRRCTGQSNALILENLRYLDEKGASIEIRIPFVPGYNAEEIPAIGAFLLTLRHIRGIRVLPYHNYAGSKYRALDMENTLPPVTPTDEEVNAARKTLSDMGLPVLF